MKVVMHFQEDLFIRRETIYKAAERELKRRN